VQPDDPISEFHLRTRLQRLSGLTPRQVAELPQADVVLMTKTLARSNYLAGADRALTAEIPDRRGEAPFERRSYRFAVILFTLTVLALAVTCGLFGRIIL
jgi:hypothetical protein